MGLLWHKVPEQAHFRSTSPFPLWEGGQGDGSYILTVAFTRLWFSNHQQTVSAIDSARERAV